MVKYYYENKLASQNITAKTDIVWAADFSTLELKNDKNKLHIFLCIDLHTNYILARSTSLKTISSAGTIRVFKKLVKDTFPFHPEGKPDIPVIIHTDRGTQFTSKSYKNFLDQYQNFIEPSMSRKRTPKDNAVMERFVRTFKEHRINGIKIQDQLDAELYYDPNFSSFKKIINQYVKSLNETVNKKTSPDTPKIAYEKVQNASRVMYPPIYTKAFSEVFGNDPRIVHIEKYKQENKDTNNYLADIAATQAELTDKTPFDTEEQNLVVNRIANQLSQIYTLIQSNPQLTKQYVENALEPIKEVIEEIDRKVDILLPKEKKDRTVQKLRDPIDQELFPIFLSNAGSASTRKKELIEAQLRICYTLLYHIGLRVNELRVITLQEILEAMETSQITLITYKTKQSHIYILSKQAIRDLRKRQEDFETVFYKNNYKYLFGKDEPIHEKSLIRLINKDLKNTCHRHNISFNVKSHSFRIHVISSLLKRTNVQDAANIIGHNDIRSTLKYSRYSMSKKEIQELLDDIANSKPERLQKPDKST